MQQLLQTIQQWETYLGQLNQQLQQANQLQNYAKVSELNTEMYKASQTIQNLKAQYQNAVAQQQTLNPPNQAYIQQPQQPMSQGVNIMDNLGNSDDSTSKFSSRPQAIITETPLKRPQEESVVIKLKPMDGHEFEPLTDKNVTVTKEVIGDEYRYKIEGKPMKLNLLNIVSVAPQRDLDKSELFYDTNVLKRHMAFTCAENGLDGCTSVIDVNKEYFLDIADKNLFSRILTESNTIDDIHDELTAITTAGSNTALELDTINNTLTTYVNYILKNTVGVTTQIEDFLSDWGDLKGVMDKFETDITQNIYDNLETHLNTIKHTDLHTMSDHIGKTVLGDIVSNKLFVLYVHDIKTYMLLRDNIYTGVSKKITNITPHEMFKCFEDLRSKNDTFRDNNEMIVYTKGNRVFKVNFNTYKRYYVITREK